MQTNFLIQTLAPQSTSFLWLASCATYALTKENHQIRSTGVGYGGAASDHLGEVVLAFCGGSRRNYVLFQELEAIEKGANEPSTEVTQVGDSKGEEEGPDPGSVSALTLITLLPLLAANEGTGRIGIRRSNTRRDGPAFRYGEYLSSLNTPVLEPIRYLGWHIDAPLKVHQRKRSHINPSLQFEGGEFYHKTWASKAHSVRLPRGFEDPDKKIGIEETDNEEPISLEEEMSKDRITIEELITYGMEPTNQGKVFTCRGKFVKLLGTN
ncbi:hypothetical protein IFM89_017086 [Coptis chinensis]|uniref:Uncharacterized protein n=1 Tax=Coptis chinensis TaxID=261450 RepID=A0A835HFG6_9MAGN|nr:hypothetical protein IFM89_017086 [Coptis chinensis]